MKFRLKIMACMLCLVSILFGAGSSALILISFQNGLEREKQSAENSYRMLMYTLQMAGNMGALSGTDDIRETLRQMTGQGESYWDAVALSSEDEMLYSHGETTEYLSRAEGRGSEESWVVTSFRTDDGRNYLRISGGFSSAAQTLYLEAAHDITALYINRSHQQNAYKVIFLLTMLLCAILAYSLSYLLTRPLSRLSRGAREIARGNLSFRAGIRSDDEIGRLSEDFDHMAKRIQKNVRELEAAVERQEQFMGSFTHELKTPMTSVIGYADLLRSRQLSEEEIQDAANYIFSEGKRLERLSLKLLDLYVAEQTEISLSVQRPGRIAEDVVAHLRSGYEEQGILLEESCEQGICMLDPDLFRSLMVNLVDNAGKALTSGIAVGGPASGKNTDGEEKHIWVSVQMTGNGCILCVEDDGPGIPEEAREHLTEAFYRVDKSRSRKQGGAGLGLTLCAKITELHGGTLSFEKREGGGTRVTALLNSGRGEEPACIQGINGESEEEV